MSRFYIIFAMLCCWGCARPREQVFKNSLLAPRAPLLDDWLLGAPSLDERDEICEAVVRWIATTQTNACCFVGFEDTTHLSDITDFNLSSQPMGQDGGHLIVATTRQPWTPKESRSVVVGYEVCRKGVRCIIGDIKLISKDEAEVHARFMSHKAALSLLWRFHLRRENGAWRVFDGGPTTALG